MRSVLLAAGLGLLGATLFSGSAMAQGLASCDGMSETQDGIKATLSAKKDTNTSGQTEVTFSLSLKDTQGGHSLSTPKTTTVIGQPATVKAGDDGEPGAVSVTFNPKSLGLASDISVKFIDARGKTRDLTLRCGL